MKDKTNAMRKLDSMKIVHNGYAVSMDTTSEGFGNVPDLSGRRQYLRII